jgi:hypothetical protein
MRMRKALILVLSLILMTSIAAAFPHDTEYTYCRLNPPDVCGQSQECIEHRVEGINDGCQMPESDCLNPCIYIPLSICTMQLPFGQLGTPYDNAECSDNPEVPEFSAVAAGIALVGAGAGFIFLRKRR